MKVTIDIDETYLNQAKRNADKHNLDEMVDAYELAIATAIPLEKVLEDIKTAIRELYPDNQCTGESTGYADAIDDVLAIIGKRIRGKEGDRLYIKIYADMEPGDIAEKVYCICNEEKLPEVVDILSEIVRDNCEDNK